MKLYKDSYSEAVFEFCNFLYNSLFKEFTQDDINSYYSLSKKFNNGIDHLEKCFLDLKEKGEM